MPHSEKELTTVRRPSPTERDALFLKLFYQDKMDLVLTAMRTMDERDDALEFIERHGLLAAFKQACPPRPKR